MRAITIPPSHERTAFEYLCPICGVDLAESDHDMFDAEYLCPVCATQRRPLRVPARL